MAKTEGAISLGAKVKVEVTSNPGRAFPVRVTALTAPNHMGWTGGMPLGLFRGTRTYTLTAVGERTTFAVEEVHSGPLASLITRSIPDLARRLEQLRVDQVRKVDYRVFCLTDGVSFVHVATTHTADDSNPHI